MMVIYRRVTSLYEVYCMVLRVQEGSGCGATVVGPPGSPVTLYIANCALWEWTWYESTWQSRGPPQCRLHPQVFIFHHAQDKPHQQGGTLE